MLGTRLRILHLLAASIGLILLAFAASNPAAAQFCTQQFDPVCARSKPVGVAKTFSNACFAKAAGAVTFAEHTTCENLICPLVFFPVCGVKNGALHNYGGQCDADRNGAFVLAPGSCPQVCTNELVRVCAVDERGRRRNFNNACEAVMKGWRVLHVGVCYRTSGCQKDLRPVCASDPRTHKPTTYGNLCAAEKANATFLSNGTCN